MQTLQLAGQTIAIPETLRENLAQDAASIMLRAIDPRLAFVFDSATGALLAAAGSDDLGYVPGTHGTDVPFISTGDVVAAGCTRKCRFTFTLPPEYVSGGSVILVARAGMKTTVADVSATIDFAVYKMNGTVVTGSDLVTTSATSINSLTWADYTFTITPDGLVAGNQFDVLCTIIVDDAVNTGAVIAGFRPFYGCTSRG